jgi:hypothetical protein
VKLLNKLFVENSAKLTYEDSDFADFLGKFIYSQITGSFSTGSLLKTPAKPARKNDLRIVPITNFY